MCVCVCVCVCVCAKAIAKESAHSSKLILPLAPELAEVRSSIRSLGSNLRQRKEFDLGLGFRV